MAISRCLHLSEEGDTLFLSRICASYYSEIDDSNGARSGLTLGDHCETGGACDKGRLRQLTLRC